MNAIWKYPLPVTWGRETFDITMPAGARILAMQTQNDAPHLWARVDPSMPPVSRSFRVFGTGDKFDPGRYTYRGTWQSSGYYVWHLFEEQPVLEEDA